MKLTTLQCPLEEGGMALPNIRRYQIACLCSYFWHWFKDDPSSMWLALEGAPVAPFLSETFYMPLRNGSALLKGQSHFTKFLESLEINKKIKRVLYLFSLPST